MVDRRGYLRPQYRAVLPLLTRLNPERMEEAKVESQLAYDGDNAQHPIPRILTESEMQRLRKGVEQRGTALQRFLADHYSGKKTYRHIIPEEVVEKIIRRTSEQFYEKKMKGAAISFPYGPDLMRAPSGEFMVVEDNLGFVGGPGDIVLARKLLEKLAPELIGRLKPTDEPKEYFRLLADHARSHAIPKDGKIVMSSDVLEVYADYEASRLVPLLEEVGITTITPDSKLELHANKQGVELRKNGKKEGKPVGYVFLNGEHSWMDGSHKKTTRPVLLISEAMWALEELEKDGRFEALRQSIEDALKPKDESGGIDLKRLEAVLRDADIVYKGFWKDNSSAKGVMKAFFAGKVALNYSPGVDFANDKLFKKYVDDLVRFYMHEEPIIRSIPVEWFGVRNPDGTIGVNEPLITKQLEGGRHVDWVFKIVDGRGGKGIYIGPKMSEEERIELIEQIRKDPGRWTSEPYTTPSTLAGQIVDLRLLAQVSEDQVVVSPTPWSRGVGIDGNGKVNLSDAGHELPVVVVKDPPMHVWVKGENGLERLTIRRRPVDFTDPTEPSKDAAARG
jgi:uncharacterized circularly permuted ATP-grasp superfamily protein